MFFQSLAGIIALDIDGTITDQMHLVPEGVIKYFEELVRRGWKIIFITGRPFQWSYNTLKKIRFSYHIAVQNGALLLEMPTQIIRIKKYLSKDSIQEASLVCQKYQTDFIVYSGHENNDLCYFRPSMFSPEILNYLNRRSKTLNEKWLPVSSFNNLQVQNFPSIKCFAKENEAFLMQRDFENQMGWHAPPNKDPFDPNYYVVQATHSEATKGNILREYCQLVNNSGPIIVAGDDNNDESMLKLADVKIVMENAPEKLLSIADIIAPKAEKEGIIKGLQDALQLLSSKQKELS